MAEQKDEFDSKREEEKLSQYRREQEVLENRVLLGDQKAKLGLAWMYDQPAIMEPEKVQDEKQIKFEWQRKYNAPRESYCKNSADVTDQPFGIEVRNVRCMRCKKWGHLNTDRVCSMYGQSFTQEPTHSNMRELDCAKKALKKEGLVFKKSTEATGFNDIIYKARKAITGGKSDSTAVEHELVVKFMKNLSSSQREKLLKKLSRLPSDEVPSSSHKHSHKHGHKSSRSDRKHH